MSGIRSLPMIKLLTGLLLLVWPFLIWLGLVHNSLRWLLPLMALLAISIRAPMESMIWRVLMVPGMHLFF